MLGSNVMHQVAQLANTMSNTTFPRMHISLYVSDLQQSLQFYTDFFGVEPAKVKPKYAKYVLDRPSLIISFVENAERVQQNFGHLGFQVETQSELKERLAAAQHKNLVTREEIGTNCCYAMQDKFWANDPDGVQWEIYYFHADAEFNDPHYETSAASACCIPAQVPQTTVESTFISLV
jgi:catechol 2,3-dioxygenase-like lactoylglutathione lyase family enzyme